jgi:SAM-dependent methyltransferase
VLGDDLGALLGGRIQADHSRQTLADAYARPARRVLDLGCGAGDSVDLFRSLDPGVDWIGADVESSPEVAARTRSDATFVTFDGERLPFDGESFDFVYCKQVLEHVRRPDPLIREVARVLRPEGLFAGSTSQLEAFHSRSVANPTPYGLTVLLEDAGLEVIELRPGIDGFTLVAWRALGMPRFFARWWARESPGNRVIETAGRLAQLDARTRNQVKLTLCGQFAFLARRRQGLVPRKETDSGERTGG